MLSVTPVDPVDPGGDGDSDGAGATGGSTAAGGSLATTGPAPVALLLTVALGALGLGAGLLRHRLRAAVGGD